MRLILPLFFGFFLSLVPMVSFAGAEPSLHEPAFTVKKTRSDPGRPARPVGGRYEVPIIDTHAHLHYPGNGRIDDTPLLEILKAADSAGVEQLFLMPTPNEGRDKNNQTTARQRFRIMELSGGRVKVLCGSNYITYWLHNANSEGYSDSGVKSVLARLSADIDSRFCSGVGEIGIFHFNKSGHQPVIQYPPDFPPLLEIMAKIVEKGAWLDIHAEPVEPYGRSHEDALFGGLALWFKKFPDLKLIMSHTAMTSPANARKILTAYPNVMMNIKFIKKHDGWRNLEAINNEAGELYEDWASLLEYMPERFMIGSDAKFMRRNFTLIKYVKNINNYRRILGTINARAARMIAFGNARRVFPP